MTLRLSVRTKILSGFGLLFMLFLSVLIFNVVQMRQIQWQLSIVQQGYLPLTKMVASIENNQQAMERYLDPERLITREQTPSNLYPSLAFFHLSRMEESIKDSANQLERTRHMPGAELEARSLNLIRGQIGLIERGHQDYSEAFRGLIKLLGAGQSEQARASLPRLREQMGKVSRAIRDLSALLDSRVEAAVEQTRGRQERTAVTVAILSFAAFVFGLIMIFVTHLVLRPISRLIQGVQYIGRGDYHQRVAIEADDEIGTLASEFNAMATNLEERETSLQQKRRELEDAYLGLRSAHLELQTLSLYNENILRSIEVGLLVCDRDERLTTLNPAAQAQWGLKPEDARGQKVSEIEALAPIRDVPREVLASGAVVRIDAVEHQTDDGPRLFDCAVVPLTGLEGIPQGVIILTEDVTERTRTRQRLIQSERLALIGRMGAQVTHEIRNPLNALGLNGELLEDELRALDPNQSTDALQLLLSMRKELDRLTDITESYLRLARLPTPRLERVDVGVIVESLLRFVREELESRQLQLEWHIAEALPEALVDENQLRQALLNILRNAGEAAEAGARRSKLQGNLEHTGKITVDVKAVEGGVELAVSDNGEGMDAGVQSRIFDAFYSTKATGNGLGLPITQQIIEEHGGQITCESHPGEGTTFRIRLPAP